MAKGQVRGNREQRKPKKDKAAAAPAAPTLGAQVRHLGSTAGSAKKK